MSKNVPSNALRFVTSEPTQAEQARVCLGCLVALDADASPIVAYTVDGCDYRRSAYTTVPLVAAHLGKRVALQFVDGDPQQPLISGVLWKAEEGASVRLDVQDMHIEAARKLVFRCGKTEICMSEDGKLSIRGRNLLARASRIHRILGGSVQIN